MFRSKALRPITGVVLITFTALTLQPLTAAAQLPSAPKRAPAQSESGEERFSRTLNEIHEILKEVVPQAAMPHMFRSTAPTAAGKPGEKVLQAVGPKMRLESERAKPLPGVDVTAKVKTLRGKYKELKSLEAEVTKGFKETEKHIRDKNLPPEILARHEQAVAEYERRKAEFNALMQAVEAAADGKGELQPALASLGEFMAKYPNAKTHTPTDPNNLPWGSPKPVTRAPYTSPAQFKTSRLFGEPVRVAQAGSLSGIGLPNTTLPNTPTPADLAATEDVQITPAIRELAASLKNQPVLIYNWVRNNVSYVPSFGSIQGSDMTLQTKRGNAFDTASLLIALLRAAGVPARYVYGTIEVPVERAMNWVGGVTAPQAAISLMSQGGIPVVGIAQGGAVTRLRLETVWVEAFVDYVPSRGAVNRVPDTWVPLDASFKQYQFTQGMNIKTSVPFDAQSFLTQLQQGATINEAEGWVSNVDPALIQQTVANYQTRVEGYANGQKPKATVGDVLGAQDIVQENRPILLGTLPHTRIATGARFQVMPDNLRWKFRYNVYASEFDRVLDSPSLTLQRNTVSLAGKKITLSFSPATSADQATVNSFVPQPHADGTPIQPTELPRNLPGYLIRLVPELRVDNELVASGPAATMGTELIQNAAYFNAAFGQWEEGEDNRPSAGEYIATAMDLQGFATVPQSVFRARLENTRTRLDRIRANPTDPTPLQGLSKEDLAGDLLYGAIGVYFGAIDRMAQIAGKATGVVNHRMPSFGNFGIASTTVLSFGVPRSVRFAALAIDVDRIIGTEIANDASPETLLKFRKSIGTQYSAQEHVVPEQLFADPAAPAPLQAMSAVKALALAASAGQRIYILNSSNSSLHASILSSLAIDGDVKQEIANALAVGREVTVHQASVTVNGFTGVGYIILDPQTGAGAYKISGGANGGAIAVFWGAVLMFLQIALGFLTLATGALFIIGSVAALAAVVLLVLSLLDDPIQAANFAAVRALMAILAIMFFIVVEGFVALPIAIIGIALIAMLFAVIAIVRALLSVAVRPQDDGDIQFAGLLYRRLALVG